MDKVKTGKDIVSGFNKVAKKIGINLKDWCLPKHKQTGPWMDLETKLNENGNPNQIKSKYV